MRARLPELAATPPGFAFPLPLLFVLWLLVSVTV